MSLVTVRLTRTEAEQLLSYAAHRDICGEAPGWYYGNREHFERRHASILNVLTRALTPKEKP
jgi:hypothetical protein